MQTFISSGLKRLRVDSRRAIAGAGLLVTSATFAITSGVAMAAPPAFSLNPFTFVGAAGDCGTGYPAGSNIVTAKWDSSTGNPSPSILLQKNGPTSDCSAAGVDI